MIEGQAAFLKIAIMFLVMVAGWWASRRDYLSPALTRALGILVVQVTFPSLILVQMLGSVNADAVRRGWWIPLFALASILLAEGVGRALSPVFRVGPLQRRTFSFLVGMPNWVFLPLPIAEALYGAEGVRFVLLYNLGAQAVLWTLGIRHLQGGKTGIPVWLTLCGNMGILATIGGVAIALAWPGAATLGDTRGSLGRIPAASLVGALKMIGDLTIPLSLLATGAQLGFMVKASQFHWRPLAGVTLARLVIAPAVTVLLLKGGLLLVGARMPEVDFMTAVVIVAMPVAISCTVFAERFGGDGDLSASAIFITTLVSLVTVPLSVIGSQWLYHL